MNSMHAAALVAAMSVMTILTRFLPFIVFSALYCVQKEYAPIYNISREGAAAGYHRNACDLLPERCQSHGEAVRDSGNDRCSLCCGTAGLEEKFVDQYFDRNCGVYGDGADGVWVI